MRTLKNAFVIFALLLLGTVYVGCGYDGVTSPTYEDATYNSCNYTFDVKVKQRFASAKGEVLERFLVNENINFNSYSSAQDTSVLFLTYGEQMWENGILYFHTEFLVEFEVSYNCSQFPSRIDLEVLDYLTDSVEWNNVKYVLNQSGAYKGTQILNLQFMYSYNFKFSQVEVR